MTNAEIKQFIAERIAQGVSLSKIQDALDEEKQVKLTFMELRLLASEIESADWSKLDKPEKKADPAQEQPAAPEETPEEEESFPAEEEEEVEDAPLPEETADKPAKEGEKPLRGKTVVELSKVAMPGVAASGTVKFGSGSSAEWYLDQTGRLGLGKLKGAQPDEQDIQEFQMELRKALGM